MHDSAVIKTIFSAKIALYVIMFINLLVPAMLACLFVSVTADSSESYAVASSSSSFTSPSSSSTGVISIVDRDRPENETFPAYCNVNEKIVACPDAVCVPKTCSDLGFPVACLDLSSNARCPTGPDCICNEGYVRNQAGICIPENQCSVCNQNEIYDLCPAPCPPRICGVDETLILCLVSPQLGDPDCEPRCRCIDGFVRDLRGICIPKYQCPLVCSNKHEVYSDCINGGCFARNCSQYGKQVPCVKLDPKNCIKGCVCKEGYLRSNKGTCVPEKECPESCNGPNEVFNECSYNCPPQTCRSLGKSYICPLMEKDNCKPMCKCIEGYYRNAIGQCISEDNCRKCMGSREYYSCGGACDNVCATLQTQSQANCSIRNIKCNEMCYCEKNYARAKNGTCIPIKSCNELQCPVNERYEKSPGSSCEPRKCSQLGLQTECHIVAHKKCPENPSCVCIDEYVRNDEEKCIPIHECPDVCGINEVFENCSYPSCKPRNCTQLGFPLECDQKDCKKGCICKEEFVRDFKGICIPIEKCPSCGGDTNAKSGCGVNCLKTCFDLQNRNKPRPCLKICRVNACDCKDGYYLDENISQCVLPEDCTTTCGENEVYDSCINGGCGMRNCSQLGEPILCIDPIECMGGCSCTNGFLRLDNGTCVSVEQCPEPQCGKRERFEICPEKLCQPLSCNQLGFPINCPDENEVCPGRPACICDVDYVTNRKGICVSKKNCPSCGGDPNAQSGCGINCEKRCPNNNLNPKLCPRICLPNSCDCKDGYFFDKNVDSCVLLEDCSPSCDDLNNEIYDSCVNGGCGYRNCSQLTQPEFCIDPLKCIQGCRCNEGYLRLKNGTCVLRDKCPVTTTTSQNTTEAIADFDRGIAAFAGNSLYFLLQSRPGTSFMFSPFSVLIALAQICLYAVGPSRQQLLSLMNLKSKNQVRAVFPVIISEYENQDSVIFKIANKYYSNINVPFTENFIKESKDVFDSEGESIDFSRSQQAADTINNWVSDNTGGLINNLVNADIFNADTILALINALFFLGNWQYQFNPNNTKPRDFNLDNGDTVSLDTMFQQNSFRYAESTFLDCKVLELPYVGGDFKLLIFLPNKSDNLLDLVEKLRNPDNFGDAISILSYETVIVYLPRMDITTDIPNLTELLKKCNLTAPFDPNANGFKGIVKGDIPIFISDAIQKTVIQVTETGTKAAAATGTVISTLSVMVPPPKVYIVDCKHSFVFTLVSGNRQLFVGIFSG